MRRKVSIVVMAALAGLLVAGSSLAAIHVKEAKTALAGEDRIWHRMSDDNRMKGNYAVDKLICVDGFKIFQTIAFGGGDGTGAAISNVQLYEEKNGQVVPARCR